jgi:hypothetical protein
MARYFVTGFGLVSGHCAVDVQGLIVDQALSLCQGQPAGSIEFDPTSSISARQQIQDQMVLAINTQLIAAGIPLTLIGSDIEYIC